MRTASLRPDVPGTAWAKVVAAEPADQGGPHPQRAEPDGHLDLDVRQALLGALGRLAAGQHPCLVVLGPAESVEDGLEAGVGDAQRGGTRPLADGELHPGDDHGVGRGGGLHEAGIRLQAVQLGLHPAERLEGVGQLAEHAGQQVPDEGLLDVGQRPVGLLRGAGTAELVVDDLQQRGNLEAQQGTPRPRLQRDHGADGLVGEPGEVLVVAELLDDRAAERADHPQARRQDGGGLPPERLHRDAQQVRLVAGEPHRTPEVVRAWLTAAATRVRGRLFGVPHAAGIGLRLRRLEPLLKGSAMSAPARAAEVHDRWDVHDRREVHDHGQ
jgi:hypothetical protein